MNAHAYIHTHTHTHTYRIRKKAIPTVLGQGIVRKLTKVYIHTHTHTYTRRIKKKATPTVLGQGIVRKLSKKHSVFLQHFVHGRNEYLHDQKKSSELSEVEDSRKAKVKKAEKASAANMVVISTDAIPPVEAILPKRSILAKMKGAYKFKKRRPDVDMTARGAAQGADHDHEKGDDKAVVDSDAKISPSKTSADRDCHVQRSASYIKIDEEQSVQAFGIEMYELLHFVMGLLWEPDQMNERLIVLSTRLFLYGLRLEHLDDLGDAIHTALRVVLECPCAECGNHEWDDEISGAWGWLWTSVTTSMKKTIGSLQNDHHKIVRECWEIIKSVKTGDEIGETLYTELGREAPFVLHLFQRPKSLQAYMWVQALELLVVFCELPERFFEELRALTIRHVKYGVKAEYIKPFGKALLTGVADLLGDKYDPVRQAAWSALWQRVSTCVARSLNVGTNLITVSLVNGDLDRLQDAITCAPRNERVSWVCRVEVYGSILSPLYWAIRDGKFEIAEFLISDALSIKADRDNYYYGRQELCDTHPDLLAVLCRDCPSLVETYLDGLLWHSQTVEEGRLRANYYIADMFGDPKKYPDAFKSALAIVAMEGEPSMFGHPIMEKLLKIKWDRFGCALFCASQAVFLTLMVLYTEGFVSDVRSCAQHLVIIKDVVGVGSACILLLMAFIMVRQSMFGICLNVNFLRGLIVVPIPRLLTNAWQVLRFIAVCMIVALVVSSPCNHFLPESSFHEIAHHRAILRSITSLCLYLQLLQALVMSATLSTLVYAAGQLIKDIARNFLLIAILLVAFAAALTSLDEPDSGFDNFGDSCWILLTVVTGAEHAPIFDMHHPFGSVLLIAYLLCASIGLLSILTAQVTLAYQKLSTDMSGFAKMYRAFLVVEIESLLPLSFRQKMLDELNFHLPLEFDNGDKGPSGGMQEREPASVRAHAKYCPDRIQRSTGSSCPTEPWPRIQMVHSSSEKSTAGGGEE
jgi:hemoglobin-like flavoprotein